MGGPVLRWVLTGGIGSGKSTVAEILRGFGVPVVDADRLGHAVLEPGGEAFSQVAGRWPEVVVDGRIDRRELGRIVFEDRSQLSELEAMVHPPVTERLKLITNQHDNLDLVVEISVPKKLINGRFDVVVVDAPDPIRRERLLERGLSEGEVEQRMRAQPAREEWLELSDLVIQNAGSLDRLEDSVSWILAQTRARIQETE